jgi:polyisoprenoid-binding protein YceI
MKIPMVIKKTMLPFFLALLIISCKDSSEKKSGTKSDEVSTTTTKDTTAKKDDPTSSEKNNSKKWTANASTAQIKFSVKGPFGTVHGSLSGLRSTILFDADHLAASSIRASADPKSISTGIKLRNSDLQKEKYLDSDKYPSISFQSDKIQKSGTGYKAIGNLTIKGVTKNIELPFHFSEKGNAGVFKGSFTIQRHDYGVGPSGGLIGSTVTIDLEVPVTK